MCQPPTPRANPTCFLSHTPYTLCVVPATKSLSSAVVCEGLLDIKREKERKRERESRRMQYNEWQTPVQCTLTRTRQHTRAHKYTRTSQPIWCPRGDLSNGGPGYSATQLQLHTHTYTPTHTRTQIHAQIPTNMVSAG